MKMNICDTPDSLFPEYEVWVAQKRKHRNKSDTKFQKEKCKY